MKKKGFNMKSMCGMSKDWQIDNNIDMSENCSFFSKFTEEVQEKVNIVEALQSLSKGYSLSAYKIQEINAQYAFNIYKSIQDKFYKKSSGQITNNWFENQLRIFVWTLICYVSMKKCMIESLNDADWDFFQRIFPYKDTKLFDYQTRALAVEPTKGKHWQKYEQDLLKDLMKNKNDKTKWNQISKQLYHQSNKKYFRTAKQCRQHWNNHLDPNKVKGNWKPQQYLLMFNFVKNEGKKWASLVKKLGNSRNEHSIKNKFNSLVKKQRKITSDVSEEEIYDVIINRIQKHLDRETGKASELSFEEDFNSSNYQPKQENVLPVPSIHSRFIKQDTLPTRPAAFTSSFSQKFMQKLQKFNTNKTQKTQQPISGQNIKTSATIQKNTPKRPKKNSLMAENYSLSEAERDGIKYEEEDEQEHLLDLEIEKNNVFLNDQQSPQEAERKFKNDKAFN